MKHSILLGMLLSYIHLSACDLCGGVGSNASIGIFAANQFHLVGWRSQVRSFDSYLFNIKHSSEVYWQNDLTFRTQLGPKVQPMGLFRIKSLDKKRILLNQRSKEWVIPMCF
jgi:hypothetical protein